ncbi:cell division protein FtsZ [Candidatus Micrarchaeota archaeon CG08_land_8_20_14_0_20_49_17]|nr:MAG: cell division protein FtsZ [Candidatus Micrarchaeota archaeon CG08_land_8_20_14_0_20_49_17]PIZ97839.1 MAG: cell division protein FtsZ [Candidatus Micrarchaeota archaeon CG_4_10_14_0_2_um_filter_49_7]HII53416.1 cell division protein FtsZ [Candidatus Micrarchaeota archaeon]
MDDEFFEANIVVIGAGGAGSNTINRISTYKLPKLKLIAINTDNKHLKLMADGVQRVLIGREITKGLGAGGDPEIAMKAAEISKPLIAQAIGDANLVFIVAGMGGGTGTGAAPIIARIAKESGTVVVAFVTYPFKLERVRLKKALIWIEKLQKEVDTIIILDNNKLLEYVPGLPINDAFRVADEIVARAIGGIAATILTPSLVNLDYADVRSIMENGGIGMISVGDGKGIDKVAAVTESTRKNKLLDIDMTGAKNILVHITGGTDLTIADSNDVVAGVTKGVDNQANVIMGARIDPSFCDKIETIAIYTKLQHKPILAGAEMDKPKEEDIYYHPPPNLLR